MGSEGRGKDVAKTAGLKVGTDPLGGPERVGRMRSEWEPERPRIRPIIRFPRTGPLGMPRLR